MPANPVQYVGVDVSKRTLAYALTATTAGQVANTAEGHRQLLATLRPVGAVRVIVEATGGYQDALVAALWAAAIEVSVVPPGRVRHFAKALGLRAKTDPIDAQLLRRYGEHFAPRLTPPTAAAVARLRQWLEARRALVEQRVAWQNRQEVAGKILQRVCGQQLALIERQLIRIEAQIRQEVAAEATQAAQAQRWQQVCGIGPICAWSLLAWLPEIHEAAPNELVALVGLAPYPDDSGQHSGPRHIAGGRAEIRQVLHMAARSAREHNPILREFGDRLEQHGKPYKVIITAISRKLLLLLQKLAVDPNFALAS